MAVATTAAAVVRRRWWGFTVGVSGVLIAGLVLSVQAGFGGTAVTTWLDNSTETGAALIAAAASLGAAARHRGRLRAAWSLMGASALCWGLGQLAWDWYQLIAGIQVPFPSLA